MKKIIRKLVVRNETLRTLRTLDSRELTRAVGGDGVQPPETGDVCPGQGVVTTVPHG